jgi:hypothetical protein
MDDQEYQRLVNMMYWAELLHEDAMAVVCAAIKTHTGSLESAATVLEWANFHAGPYSFSQEEWDSLEDDPKATLELWVKKNSARIERARRSVFFAAAARGVLMDESDMPEEED